MAEEVIAIKIIPDGMGGRTPVSPSGNSSGSGVSPAGIKGISKGVGGAMSGVLKGLGIGSVIGVIVMIASHMKSLMNVIGQIIKMVSLLLKPIADVVMVLLMPILMILKPFVVLMNQIMAPFLKLGMSMMRQGGKALASGSPGEAAGLFAGAAGVMIAGLASVMVALNAEIIRMIKDIVFDVLRFTTGFVIDMISSVVQMISPFGDQKIAEYFEKVKKGLVGEGDNLLNTLDNWLDIGIDNVAGGIIAGIGRVTAEAAKLVGAEGSEVAKFKTSLADTVSAIFPHAELLIKGVLGVGTSGGLLFSAKSELAKTGLEMETFFGEATDQLGKTGKSSIERMIAKWKEAFEGSSGGSSSSGSSNKSFWQGLTEGSIFKGVGPRLATGIKYLGDDDKWWS